jgi:hypothetical protein
VHQSPQHLRNRICAGCILLTVIVLSWAGLGQRLLTRPLWMDEIHSWLLISDADVGHAMSALADGADYNPPTYYLVARSLAVFGPITEYRLRLLSLLFTAATALAIYLMLSRRFTAAASVAATLFATGHQLLVLQSTETRFYALWICLSMWYCWLLTKDVDGKIATIIQRISLAIIAVAICTTHYFGIISVGLVTTVWTICQLRNRWALILGSLLTLCCVLTVACCLPMLSGQKAALTCATWVKPPTIATSTDYLLQFLPMLPFGLCIAAAAAGWVSRQQALHADESQEFEFPQPAAWGMENTVLIASILMPLVLIAFSWIVQPALVNRYAIIAVVAMVPIYAWLLSRATEAIQNTCVGIAAVMVAFSVHNGSETWEHNLRSQFELQQSLAALPDDEVVVFEDRIDFWLLQQMETTSRKPAWFQVDFETDDLARPSTLRTVQRDVGRRTQKWYPDRFPMKALSTLTDLNEFVVVPYVDRPFGELRFPDGYESQRINDRMFRLRRTPLRTAVANGEGSHKIGQ